MRMRADEFERIRRKLEGQRAQVLESGAPSHVGDNILNPSTPWDAVLRHAASDEALSFWSRE
eukprot:1104462-Amphidinium_carterae.1